MVNWNTIFNVGNVSELRSFASGQMSGRQLYNCFTHTSAGGEIRNALRTKGVDRLRRASREALRRRQLV